MRLTGKIVIDHYTAANFSRFYDVDRLDWVDDMALGIISRGQRWRARCGGHDDVWIDHLYHHADGRAGLRRRPVVCALAVSGQPCVNGRAGHQGGTLTHWFRDQFARELSRDQAFPVLATGRAKPGDIADWNPQAAHVSAKSHPVYDHQYGLFRRLYEQTKDIAAELSPN